MKKSLLILFTACICQAYAQIPNPGFEQTSTTMGLCNTGTVSTTVPTGYAALNNNPSNSTTTAHSGTKALVVATYSGNPGWVETFDCNTFQPFFPFTGAIPTAMTAWVRRATPISNDTLQLTIQIQDNSQFPVAQGGLQITGAGYTAYTQVTVPITVIGGTPSTAIIAFTGSFASNSSWFIDDLATTTVGVQTYGRDNFSMFHNASSGALEIVSGADDNVAFLIYDMIGNKVLETSRMQIASQQKVSVPTPGLKPGIYLVQAQDKTGILATKRILIQ